MKIKYAEELIYEIDVTIQAPLRPHNGIKKTDNITVETSPTKDFTINTHNSFLAAKK